MVGGGKALFYLEENVFVEECPEFETLLKFLYFSWRLLAFHRVKTTERHNLNTATETLVDLTSVLIGLAWRNNQQVVGW